MKIELIFALALLMAGCQKTENTELTQKQETFEANPSAKAVTPGDIDEVSGIADSKTNPGYLWVEQDGGNLNEIALLSHNGGFLKKITIKSAVNQDWEDMVVANGPEPGVHYIYLAETGDNDLLSLRHAIYRFAEPMSSANEVTECDKLVFDYPDSPHDADAILVDNNTRDIYIITKQDAASRIYKLPYPQNTGTVNKAVLAGSLPFSGVTAAAISPGGTEILIRTYEKIYYWKRTEDQPIAALLATTPQVLPHQPEPQGEAICFKNDDTGFFTLSERPSVIPGVALNFYKRK